MTRFQQRRLVTVLAFLIGLAANVAHASSAPRWSDDELIGFSDVILTGRIVDITSGWDTSVGSIYTYVHVDVFEVLKGAIGTRRVIVKQLGGEAGEIGLAIADQPSFTTGEEVLLFLEARPRDGSLATVALWQGKWTMETDGAARVAVRAEPAGGSERRELGAISTAVKAASSSARALRFVEPSPADAVGAAPYVFMSTPYRYAFIPPVDVQSGGQPGLSGGGLSQIVNAITRWNSTGSSFRFGVGGGTGPRCYNDYLGTSRITIGFMDPCDEVSDAGGTLAVGGSYYSTSGGTTVNGVFFRPALEGFIINNDSSTALTYLTNSGCFSDIQLHELGHVLGLGHSGDTAAIMYPTVSFGTCSANAGGRNLGSDDANGQKFIYPGAGGAPGQPTVTSATVTSGVLRVVWASGSGAAPTSHRLDFFLQGGGLVATITAGAATSINIPLPAGTSGAFAVRVTALNGATAGPGSPLYNFTIGSSCAVPASPNVTGGVSGGTAWVSWPAVAGATSYRLSAGTTVGGQQYVPLSNIGSNRYVSAAVPAGFSAWVRVIAVNACGQQSVPRDYHVQ
jgi:hypothetical protein